VTFHAKKSSFHKWYLGSRPLFKGMVALALVALAATACNPTLAKYEDKQVKQQDLEKWIDQFYPFQKKNIMSNVRYQENILRQIAIIDLAARAGRASSLEKKGEFQKSWEMERRRLLVTDFEKKQRELFQKNPQYELDVVKASHILFRVENTKLVNQKRVALTPGEKEQAYQQARAKAMKVYPLLTQKRSFADIAKMMSEDASKGKGGSVGYFTRKNMMVEPFAEAAFTTEVGKVTQPVKSPFGYHVILVEDKTKVTPKNVNTIFPEAAQKQSFERNAFRSAADDFVAKLQAKANKWITVDAVRKGKSTEVVFSFMGLEKSRAQFLEEYFRLYQRKKISDPKEIEESLKSMKDDTLQSGIDYFNRFYTLSQKVIQEPGEFQDIVSEYKKQELAGAPFDRFLASSFLDTLKVSALPVTEKQIREEYDRRYNPKNRPATIKPKPGQRPQPVLPPKKYDEVKEQIRLTLQRNQENLLVRSWIEKRLREAKFEVFKDKLKATEEKKPAKQPQPPKPHNK